MLVDLATCRCALIAAAAALCFGSAPTTAAQQQPATVQLVPAQLAGVVRDSTGAPIRDAEVIAPAIGRSLRTDANGKFELKGVVPGRHEVWFRHIGFTSVPFDWQADEGKRVEIDVALHALPHTLDPVLVYGRESRSLHSTSSLAGVVVDSGNVPVPNVDVQLIGTGRTTVTGRDGTFEFRHVPPSILTVRARHVGYGPTTLTMDVKDDEQRSVSLRVRRLAQTLDAMVTEASGYGAADQAWREFDQRSHWMSRSGDAKLLGPEQLVPKGSMGIDWVLRPYVVEDMSRANSHITTAGMSAPDPTGGKFDAADVCVLENGVRPRLLPLSAYDADDVDRVEYYPPDRDDTHTIEPRMSILRPCMRDPQTGHIPAYYVVWLKNGR
jgi:hypothetical protein